MDYGQAGGICKDGRGKTRASYRSNCDSAFNEMRELALLGFTDTGSISTQKMKHRLCLEGKIEKLGRSTRDMWEDDEPCKHGIVVRMYSMYLWMYVYLFIKLHSAIRPCHPSHSMPLALILPRGDQ